MEDIFPDISKYYAATIYDNILVIGKIKWHANQYQFVRDPVHGPFNLTDQKDDVASLVQVIGEIHPLSALEGIVEVKLGSCLYLNENNASGEIEVRSIHKGMGTSIYSKQECPLILWNPNYEEHRYFDVIDVQGVFGEERLKNSFTSILSESLRELELFPPLVHIQRQTTGP